MVDVVAAGPVVSRRRVVVRGWVWLPLAIFLFSRLVGGLVLVAMADQQIPRVDQSTMHVVDSAPANPGYLDLVSNWDGQWYQDVVEHGYPRELPRADGVVQQNNWAFYPLYPALVRAVMVVTTLPFGAAASLVSILAAAGAMVVLYRMLESRVGRFNASMTVLALSMSPAAIILQTAYTEGLALLVLVGCLALLAGRRYLAFAGLSVALALTRPIALPLAALALVHGIVRLRRADSDPFPAEERRRWAVAVGVSGLSFGLWPLVCAACTGEPSAFLETQEAWISTNALERSWLGAIFHHPTGTASLLALSALAVALVIVARPAARPWGLELRWWVLLYAGYLLATASPVASSIRYALLVLVPWWPATAPEIAITTSRKVGIAAFAVVFGVLCQIAWVRYFYVLGPDQALYP